MRNSGHHQIRHHKVIAKARQQKPEEDTRPAEQREHERHNEEASVILRLKDEPDQHDHLEHLNQQNDGVDHDVSEHHLSRVDASQQSSIPKAFLAIVNEYRNGHAGCDIEDHHHNHGRCHRLFEVSFVCSVDRLKKLNRNIVQLLRQIAIGQHVLGVHFVNVVKPSLEEKCQLLIRLVHVDFDLAVATRHFIGPSFHPVHDHQRLGEVLGECNNADDLALSRIRVSIFYRVIKNFRCNIVGEVVKEATRDFVQIALEIVNKSCDER